METNKIKLRKLKVKIKKPLFYEGRRPDELREFILDNRIRQCRVEVERMSLNDVVPSTLVQLSSRNTLNQRQQRHLQQHQIRRCCVRIPRVDADNRSDISSTPNSSIVHNDSFDIDDILEDSV